MAVSGTSADTPIVMQSTGTYTSSIVLTGTGTIESTDVYFYLTTSGNYASAGESINIRVGDGTTWVSVSPFGYDFQSTYEWNLTLSNFQGLDTNKTWYLEITVAFALADPLTLETWSITHQTSLLGDGDAALSLTADAHGVNFSQNIGSPTLSLDASATGSLTEDYGAPVLSFDATATGTVTVTGSGDAGLSLSANSRGINDWIAALDPTQLQEVYKLTVTGSANGLSDLVIGKISSWQATNQADGRSSYLQAVVPAAGDYLDELTNRQDGELVIFKGYRFSDGSERYEEILRSNFDTFRYDRGPRSLSATVSGYLSGKQAESFSRTLTGIRSISLTNGKYRVRCDIDLFLQPGMTVTADSVSFVADFINYYVNQNDKFCEVSER